MKPSYIRQSEMNYLSNLELNGTVVDLGGAKVSDYYKYLRGDHQIITVNMDSEYGCDIIADIEKPLPFEDASVDYVLCLNVFEHIYNIQNPISESYRMLKPQGEMIFAVPFLFHVHGSPHDFNRHTSTHWERKLNELGFDMVCCSVIGEGAFTACYSLLLPFIPRFMRRIVIYLPMALDKIIQFLKGDKFKNAYPVGYFIIAKKNERLKL